MKKMKSSTDVRVGAGVVKTHHVKDVPLGKKKTQKLRDKKRKERVTSTDEIEDTVPNRACAVGEDKLLKLRKKKRKNVKSINHFDESNEKNDDDIKPEEQFLNSGGINKGDTARKTRKGKSKNPGKMNKKRQLMSNHISSDNLLETRDGNADEEVYQMSSGDEDYSKGMKKWVTQYFQCRPEIKVLQERIDDFIMAHEAREEQARAEKLAQAAEGGWTVVVHQKGRKKTTEAESGVAVGSVAQAAVLDKMGKKKKKEVGLDFYQFNKREAHRTEIMMLQSKFEQDKKRIHQMRAARKFRPY